MAKRTAGDFEIGEPQLRSGWNATYPARYDDGCFSTQGQLSTSDQQLITGALAALRRLPEFEKYSSANEVYWLSLQLRKILPGSAGMLAQLRAAVGEVDALDAMVDRIVRRLYGPDVTLDGYGFVNNPPGSRTQRWHMDYSPDYSNIFIPVENYTAQNATQYLVLPDGARETATYAAATADLSCVNVDLLVRELGHVSVRQLLAPHFSLLRMEWGTIHRGVTNATDALRVVFYISVVRRGAEVLDEKPFMSFAEYGAAATDDVKKKDE